jgi:Domain of unknown function (DUF4190)
MKRCPRCNQQYTESWISFCSNDGTVLVESEQTPRPDPYSRPVASPGSEEATRWLPRQPPSGQGWIAPDERPPMTPAWLPPPAPYLRPPSQGLAIGSMVTGILGLVVGTFCLGPIPGIVALILGLIALSQIKKSPDRVGGKPFAIAGVVIGGLTVLIYLGLIIAFIVSLVVN